MAKKVQPINQRIEEVFAHAAALEENGRLKNTVYCLGRKIFILNQDLTVLLKFQLRKGEDEFAHPFSFKADDYDSRQFQEVDGRIEFIIEDGEYIRKKSCRTPGRSSKDVSRIFKGYELNESNTVVIGDGLLKLLDENLSHIEFSAEDGRLRIVQRNIYNGSVITITPVPKKGLVKTKTKIKTFKPVGIRTNDLIALYSFATHLTWHFCDGYAWAENVNPKMPMVGIVGLCTYDELGRDEDGRQESKKRRRQPSTDQ